MMIIVVVIVLVVIFSAIFVAIGFAIRQTTRLTSIYTDRLRFLASERSGETIVLARDDVLPEDALQRMAGPQVIV